MGIRDIKLARNPHQPTGTWIRAEKRLAIYLRDGFRCLACGDDLSEEDPWQVTLDHVIPVRDGGSNEPSNLFTCCRSCNSSRQTRRLRGTALRAVRAQTRRSLRLHLVAARAFVDVAAGEAAHRAAGQIARAYATGRP
jgi:5-methylcytosine-specific restriction protein A